MKKGFTLAEVLITLSIIGVVASMTLPSLNANIQKQQAVPGLLKGINNLQQATAIVLRDNNVRSLAHLSLVGNDLAGGSTNPCTGTTYFECINQVQSTNRVSGLRLVDMGTLGGGLSDIEYRNHAGTVISGDDGIVPDTNTIYTSQDGIAYMYLGAESGRDVYLIDINGPRKFPNTLAKDAFLVGITTRGDVVAYGSTEWARLDGGNTHPLYTGSCANNTRPTAPAVGSFQTAGATCAGAIVDNSAQLRYRF